MKKTKGILGLFSRNSRTKWNKPKELHTVLPVSLYVNFPKNDFYIQTPKKGESECKGNTKINTHQTFKRII